MQHVITVDFHEILDHVELAPFLMIRWRRAGQALNANTSDKKKKDLAYLATMMRHAS